MAWLGPWLGGGRRGGGDLDIWFGSPFSSDSWDPFGGGRGSVFKSQIWFCVRDRMVMKEKEAALFGCGIGLCAVLSPGCMLARSILTMIYNFFTTKEEVKVQVEDGNILQISGERTKEQEDKNDKWHRVERRRGSFVRRFRLPDNANVEEVKCRLDNGVLTVEVPKKETQEAQRN
ncbi:hypothetical protein RJ639_047806, partial [Escallonia herrerae]